VLKYSNLSIFQDGGHPPFLDLWGKVWDDRKREFDGLHHCAKFGCNHVNRFENTKVLIFCTFGLKTTIHFHFGAVLEVKIGENRQFLNSYPSRNAVTRN